MGSFPFQSFSPNPARSGREEIIVLKKGRSAHPAQNEWAHLLGYRARRAQPAELAALSLVERLD
jgi:hypothetical protein